MKLLRKRSGSHFFESLRAHAALRIISYFKDNLKLFSMASSLSLW